MPEIKIKIGAAVDQSMRTVFKPLTQAAAEARKQIQKEFSAISVGMRGSFTEGGATAKRTFGDTTKAGNDMSRELAKQAAQRTVIAKRESADEYKAFVTAGRNALRATEQLERQRSRGLYQQFRERERAAKQSAQATEAAVSRFAERTSYRATKSFLPNMPIMSMARRAGSEVLQGLGVDTSISSLVHRGVGIESAATALSNRGHIEGAAGANGQVVDPKALEAQARAAGKATAVNPEEILGAGRAFVGLTGDLDLWRKIMPQVVAQTKALGGNQEDAARAAGEFAAHVGNVPDKEKAVLDLMRVAAGQGKIGGVDFSDFAKYAAKAAAPAAMFQGDKAQNIGKLTALAEIAKMHGGASTPAMAFGAIDSLANTLKKPARLKSIAALLGNKNGQFADDQHSLLKDPLELAKALIVAGSKDKNGKSGLSSLDRVQSAVGDARSMKAITGLQMTFNEAGGGQKGLDAMNAELKKFSGAIMSTDEITRGLATELSTSASKAELFNQKLEGITHGVMAKLEPALEKLEEPALRLAGHLGDLAAWAASNPGAAITAAITAAILRGGVESAFRHGIESIIKNVAGSGKVGVGGISGGIAGAFSSAVVIAAIAYAIEQAGQLAIDSLVKGQVKNQQSDALANANYGVTENRIADHAKGGGYTPEDEKQGSSIEKALALRIENAEAIKEVDRVHGGAPTGIEAAFEQAFAPERGAARQDRQHIAELKAEMARVHEMLVQIHNGTLKVIVTNQNPPAAPVAGRP
jgi:hypothetical protein